MVHHRVHNSPPLVPIQSHMNPLHSLHPISARTVLATDMIMSDALCNVS